MGAREIPIAQWPEFLDQFSREHRAWLATVDRVPAGKTCHTEVVEQPLDSVTPLIAGRRIERIDSRFQEHSHSRRQIQIHAPTSVRVDETDEARGFAFARRPLPEMLDGIAPGEQPFS